MPGPNRLRGLTTVRALPSPTYSLLNCSGVTLANPDPVAIPSYPSSNVSHTELISPCPSKRNSPHSLQTQSGPDLAAFFKPLPDRLGQDDMCYLQQRGALAVPEPSLQHALLLAYIKFVHPLLPVLKLHDFFSALHLPRYGKGKMSIFLYKAVLFAASSFLDNGHFPQSDLFSRKEVSRKLFHDARLLYEFGSETDEVVLIQGLLLMTLRLDPEDGPKDASHWNGIALSLIEKLLSPIDISPQSSSACCGNSPGKRLWYCCYTRDQHIAISLHPPLRLKKRPPGMSDLSEQDFCIKPLEIPESMGFVHQDFQFFTVQAQKEMARIFIQRTRLSHLAGQALNVRYMTQRRPSFSDFDTLISNTVFAPQDHSVSSAAQLEIHLKLCELREHWLDSKLIPSPQQDETNLDISVLSLHQNYLYIFLEMIILLLYEPETLTMENYQTVEAVQVHKSCRRILQRIAYLYSRGVADLFPLEILTALQPALTSYLVKRTENVSSTAPVSEVQVLQCIQALDALGRIHGGVATDAVQYIDNLYDSTSRTITDEALPGESESFLMDLLGKYGFDF
ncbi:hypothetical protein FAUST_7694 [Fusarium austroamericanum]|uniref:Xylanolytic transcriptional activator regulatory domain-containing protein n=1 Tax=Fusarium austroamericanum TaxID=282268 RepID=A0AAN6BYK2_FUSAU|nr:hypothetical protein FAUST_7694 [Fusarium austroamericanum]